MPQKIDERVAELRSKWRSDPSSMPSLKAGQDEESAAFAICRSTLELEEDQAISLEGGVGPAIVAVAATAKPHLRQRGREIKIVEKDGKELVEVPIFRKGIYNHPRGRLVFNDATFDAMIKNHEKKVTDYAVGLDFRHTEKAGLVAFLDTDDGGWLEKKDGWLVGYGPIATEEDKKLIESRKWRYASAEFWHDYKSNLHARLSTDDLEEVTQEDILKEVQMPKELKFGDLVITTEADDEENFSLEAGDLEKIQTAFTAVSEEAGKVEGLNEKVVDLEQKIVDLSKDDDDGEDDEIPEEVKNRIAKLEEALEETERRREIEKVAVVLQRAENYRDKDGNGHDAATIELVRKGMMFEQVGEGEEAVKLEADNENSYRAYHRNFCRVLLETMPGTVPFEGKTKGSETRLEEEIGDGINATQEELDAAWDEIDKF